MANEFVIRIRADDAASATIKKIEAAFAKITDPIDKAQSRISSLGSIGQVGLEKIQNGFSKASTAARSMADSIASLVPGMAAIAGAASLAGIAGLAGKFADFGFDISKTSAMIGENRQSLQEWIIAGKRAHISAEEVASGLNGVNMAIRGADSGANAEAAQAMRLLGVETEKNADKTINFGKTHQKVFDAIAKVESPLAQQQYASIFGMSSLLPMLQRNTYNQDRIDAWKSGLVLSDEEINKGKEFQERIDLLKGKIESLSKSIGGSLTPVLMPVVEAMSKWFDANKEKIASGIADAVAKFSEWLGKIDWDSVTEKVRSFWDMIGGVSGVLIGISIITFAGPIGGLLSIIGSLYKIGRFAAPLAFKALGGVLGALPAIGIAGRNIQNAQESRMADREDIRGIESSVRMSMPDADEATIQAAVKERVDAAAVRNKGSSRGMRNNNPGNIEYGAFAKRMGATGSDGRFAIFPTMDAGKRATDALLNGYVDKGFDSVNKIINRWAPSSENNTSAYVGAVSSRLGVDPNQKLTREQLGGVAEAIYGHENGAAYTGNAKNGAPSNTPISIVVNNAQPGTKVEAKSSAGESMPAKVNYAMGANGSW